MSISSTDPLYDQLFQQAVGLQREGRCFEAVGIYNQLISLNENDFRVYLLSGIAFKEMTRFDAAEERLHLALSLLPDNPMAHNEMGCVLRRQGNFKRAMVHFQEAVRLKPDYGEAYYNLGVLKQGIPLEEGYGAYPQESIQERRFYNIGSGFNFLHPAWTNIDLESEWYNYDQRPEARKQHINYDLFSMQPIPVADGSAELVYSSHTIEHITTEAADNMFREAYRMLKKGGGIRITTPDIDLCYTAYKENDPSFFFWNRDESVPLHSVLLGYFADNRTGPVDEAGTVHHPSKEEFDRLFETKGYEGALDYWTSFCSVDLQKKNPAAHINWWNSAKLEGALRKAGFSDAYRSGYGQSRFHVLRNTDFFDFSYFKISLYVEARKT